MGTRKTNGAFEGHVDVKDAYRMAQDDNSSDFCVG